MSESKMTINNNRTKIWKNNEGKYHRLNGPAIEHIDGTKIWKKEGEYHRLDGPAVEYADGSKHWCQNGLLHRDDGPAVEFADGTKKWYQNGKLHRLDGPAVLYPDYEIWYHNDYYLGSGLDGFWALWKMLDKEQQQNVNLHIWLARLSNN